MKPSKKTATENTTMPRRGYSYLRFSCGIQAKGDSRRRQWEWAAEECERRGLFLDDTLYFHDEGVSGLRGKNHDVGELARFLEMVRGGRIAVGSVLLVENLDRLSREDVWDAWEIFRKIIEAGITIVTREPPREYSRELLAGNFFAMLEVLFIFARANEESSTKSMRIGDAWKVARKMAKEGKALQSIPPAWIEKTETGYRLRPEIVERVRRLAQLCRDGKGTGEIAALMIAEGVPGIGRSGSWRGPAVHQLLTSRTLLGEYHPHRRENGKRVPEGPPIPGFYPAIFTEDEFRDTLAALSGRSLRTGRPGKARMNIFKGLAWDADSRQKVSLQTAHSHGGLIPYLSIGQVAGCFRMRYDDLEKCLIDTLAMLRPQDVLDPRDRNDAREHRIAELTRRVTALARRKEQLQEDLADPDQDADDIRPALRKVSEELKASAKELDTLKLESRTGRAEALAECQTLGELWRDASPEERAKLAPRIKNALPGVLSGIWLQAQRASDRRQIVHVQFWLRSGLCRYVQIKPEKLCGVCPWQLESFDLRTGAFRDVGHRARMAKLAEA